MTSCSSIALDIQTYHAGQNQLTHPNVISFDQPWHGYRYYMAYTAYPYGNGAEENPCLAVSNDLLHWEKPAGLINPIACCEETECDELKDTHLLYREDLDQLEIWYLGRLHGTWKENAPLYCFRKISRDGIHWSGYEIMFGFDRMNLASPAIIYHDGAYHFWGIRHSAQDIGLYYMSSPNGTDWSDFEKCFVPKAPETNMWHGAVTRFRDTYYCVWVGTGADNQTIYLAASSDGKAFSEPQVIIRNDAGWDFLYRPALLIENETFYCFYGVVRCDGKWLVALSKGPGPDAMAGVTAQEIGYDAARSSGTRKLRLKTAFRKITGVIVPSLMLLALPLTLIALKSVWMSWLVGMLVCAAAYYFRFDRKNFVLGGVVTGTLCAAVSSFAAQMILELTVFLT